MNKKHYHHLNKIERDEMEILFNKKKRTIRDVALSLNRSPSTISRELKRNFQKKTGFYDSSIAQHKSYVKRKYARYQWKKINSNKELKEYIVEKLKQYWSPDEISGRMILEKKSFYSSKSAIYEWLDTARGNEFNKYLYSHRNWPCFRKKYRRGRSKREIIPNRTSIEDRPKRYLKEFGHWEADTAVSGRKTGSKKALSVACERKTMFLKINRIKNMKPKEFIESLIKTKKDFLMKSLTMDNGIENRDYERMRMESYFCNPYSPWQKGKVENSIKMIRRFIKKRSDIGQYSNGYVKMIENILNNKPRKSLGYATPYELFELETKKHLDMGVALEG